MGKTLIEICPQCGGKLTKVRQSPGSALNEDQFDSVKAGDYYCNVCPNNDRGNLTLCYWWNHELDQFHKEEKR